jgi:hypothetical protein
MWDPFTPEEDEWLKAAVRKHGRVWSKIAKLMENENEKGFPERSGNSLMVRFDNLQQKEDDRKITN